MKDMYRVTWLDSGMHRDLGWARTAEYVEDANLSHMRVTTVGMLMHEDDDLVILGLNYDADNDAWISAQLIARTNIINVERLAPYTEGDNAAT